MPIYCCIKDKTWLVRLNESLYKIFYAIILVFLSAGFVIVNLAMLPFAYLKKSM